MRSSLARSRRLRAQGYRTRRRYRRHLRFLRKMGYVFVLRRVSGVWCNDPQVSAILQLRPGTTLNGHRTFGGMGRFDGKLSCARHASMRALFEYIQWQIDKEIEAL